MKTIQAKLTPFSAITFMLMIVVIFTAISLVLINLSSININETINQVKVIGETNNQILESSNTTLSTIQNIGEINNQILESNIETLNIIRNLSEVNNKILESVNPPNAVFFEHFNTTEELVDDISKILSSAGIE
jgi:predicted PurR-regulated permease PerM